MKRIVLDANILIRAALGSFVFELLEKYQSSTQFLTSETAYLEVERHLPRILASKNSDPELQRLALENIVQLQRVVIAIPDEMFMGFEQLARMRLRGRDENDWHILALALGLNCSIWTEDTDFFGVGITTWKSSTVRGFLEQS
jgi:predicted nucleic acid-binding protein